MTNDERFLRAQRLILQLAGGLEIAHKNDVVHRDIKPENVVLMRAGDEESAALIDFGILLGRQTGVLRRELCVRGRAHRDLPVLREPELGRAEHAT